MADDQNPQLPLESGTPPNSGTNLIPINIEEEMRRSYLDYSMSVIIGRALPECPATASSPCTAACSTH